MINNKFCFSFLFWCFLFSGCVSSTPKGPIAGTAPLESVHVFDNHRKSYNIWKEAGIEAEILVHIDTHLDLNWFSEKDLSLIGEEEPFGSSLNKVLNRDNFLYPAVKSGFIKKIYWVVPDADLSDDKTALSRIKSVLNRHQIRITLADLKSFSSYKKNIYRGYLYDVEIIICDLNSLPRINKEVLLDFDLDYFFFNSFYFTEAKQPVSTEFEAFLKELGQKKLVVKLATIATSINGGYTPLTYRYWGAAFYHYLIDPQREKVKYWELYDRQSKALDAYVGQDYEAAKQLITEAIDLDVSNGENFYLLRVIEKSLGNEQEAAAALTACYKRDPFYQNTLLYEARLNANQGDLDAAIKLYRAFLGKEVNNAVAMVEISNLLIQNGKPESAEEYVKIAWQIDKNYAEGHNLVGNFFRAQPDSDPNLSYVAYQRAQGLSPEFTNYSGILGDYLTRAGQVEAAEKAFIEACQKGPDYDEAYNNLGYFYVNQGNNEKAEAAFKTTLGFNPEHAEAAFNLGVLLSNLGRVEQGRYWLKKAAEKMPDSPLIQQVLYELPPTKE